jgi:hypothetical protein
VERQVHLGSGFDQYGHAALLPHIVDGQHYTTFQILVVVLEDLISDASPIRDMALRTNVRLTRALAFFQQS